MTLKKDKKIAIFAVLFVVSSVFGVSQISNITAEQTEDLGPKVISLDVDKDSHLSKDGINSAIIIESINDEFNMRDGEVITAILDITHEVNDVNAQDVTLEIDGLRGIFVPSSNVRHDLNEQERIELIKQQIRDTGTISGSLDLKPFVQYSKNKVTLSPNESVQVEMQIQIPSTIANDLVNQEIDFNPNIYRVGDYGNQKIAIYNGGTVSVTITE